MHHRFDLVLFATASAAFGVVSMYASELAPSLFSSYEVAEGRSSPEPKLSDGMPGTVRISLSGEDAIGGFRPYTEQSLKDQSPREERSARSADSIVPNARSCPAENLARPLASNAESSKAGQRTPPQNGASLGTGTGCPPAALDAGAPPRAAAGAGPRAGQTADSARSGTPNGPAANP